MVDLLRGWKGVVADGVGSLQVSEGDDIGGCPASVCGGLGAVPGERVADHRYSGYLCRLAEG